MIEPGIRFQAGYLIMIFPACWLSGSKEVGCLSEEEDMLTEIWINFKKLVLFKQYGFFVTQIYPDRDERDFVKTCESIFRPGDLVEKRLNGWGMYGIPSKSCPNCDSVMVKGWSFTDLERRSEKTKWVCTNCGYEQPNEVKK